LLKTGTMRSILIIILFAGIASGQTSGTWNINRDKSTYTDDEPVPRSLVIRFEPHPEGEVVTIWRASPEGRSETDSFIQYYDGEDHPYPRQERFDFVSARKLDDGTISVIFKKYGKIVLRHARRLSADGQQMTIEEQLLSKDGQWRLRLLIFQKQKE
jgi:hypothetical protein